MRKYILLAAIQLSGIALLNAQVYSSGELDINDIRARFFADGALFRGELTGEALDGFEVPIGSGKSTFYSARLWIGGRDNNGMLRLAAEQFNHQGHDFFSGPLSTDGSASCMQEELYNRVWKINKSTIDSFVGLLNGQFEYPQYSVPQAILSWPAHGDTSLGQSFYLAPFVDVNGNGIYNPEVDGDYPKIRGDQALFFVFNDKCGLHTESEGDAIGVEVHGMAYAFNCSQDSALYNTVFVHYDIINRGSYTLSDAYVGLWSDMDIGFANDDYIECDVMRSSYFTYNGVNLDGSGGQTHYGEHPPAQAVTFLAGPYQDANNSDDAVGIGPGESLNGFGFGDGIIDNEQSGLSHFVYHNNDGGGGNPSQTSPGVTTDYYNYLCGYWLDGTQMGYGGSGHPSGGGDTAVPANFMFPADSDPLGWGTNGIPQEPWTEVTSGNVPYDRRGLGSSGPFTLAPGEINPFDIAFVFGRDYNGGPLESVAVMKDRIDAIRTMFFADSTACGGSISSVENILSDKQEVVIYPNPATDIITVACSGANQNTIIDLFNVNGQKVITEHMNPSGKAEMSLTALVPGIYLLRISSKNEVIHIKKIVKN